MGTAVFRETGGDDGGAPQPAVGVSNTGAVVTENLFGKGVGEVAGPSFCFPHGDGGGVAGFGEGPGNGGNLAVASGAGGDRKSLTDPSLWGLVFASLLGVIFLLMIPLHLNNVGVSSGETIKRINEEASQAETQLDTRLETEVGQQRQQIERLLANPEQLNRALESGQVPAEQANLLRQFQENPDNLDQFVEQRVGELRQQFQTEIGVRREDALRTARTEALKSRFRIGGSSLLLAIGYIVIGWVGLRTVGYVT
ncbi:MAG: hypothetical protein HC919_13600, partial [Oscillatoriales cyanobacterium SM2_2_1]|nr:hypothetical protein [Oscillatoriales cyanobacterium SM2_2_1]